MPTLEGLAIAYNAPTTIDGFTEIIRPGACRDSLSRRDIRALFEHDPMMLLGRTKSGTLRLRETSEGVRFALDLPETTTGRHVVELIRRGDLRGMSFKFGVPAGGERWTRAGSLNLRELRSLTLHEISVVSRPVYEATNFAMRSGDLRWGSDELKLIESEIADLTKRVERLRH